MHWLNSYLDRPAGTDEIEQLLTNQGLPIESCILLEGTDGDAMLDVEVTSNRSDCLSHLGLAREIAAGSDRHLKIPDFCCWETHEEFTHTPVESVTGVTNRCDALCPLYTARVIRGVKIGPSPDWLVQRLEAVGLRSVNNVADITNFVLLELGQPLHAFDLAMLKEQRIVVRQAEKGESIESIDGSAYKLQEAMLVIADAQKPVAIAGVMGGMDSRVTGRTTDVLLESAIFDPLSVRRTSRTLKLATDSSYRFERGVDPLGVDTAGHRAAKLICELAGGTLVEGVIRRGIDPPAPGGVEMRVDRCNQILGSDLSPKSMAELLSRLDFQPRLQNNPPRLICTVPTYRLDISREVDLIEEVSRLYGFESIPINEKIHIVARPVQSSIAARQKLGRTLTAHGYHEAVTFSFVSRKHGAPFLSEGNESVEVQDEGHKAEPMLRPSIQPSLLACRKSNQDVGNTAVRLFECAATWVHDGSSKIVEQNRLALLCDAGDAPQSLRDLRGTVEELVQQLMGDTDVVCIPVESACYNSAAQVEAGGHPLGLMGLLPPSIQQLFDLQTPLVGAELNLDTLLKNYPPQRTVRQLPRYPAIARDLSVIVKDSVLWDHILGQVLAGDLALLEDIQFIGVYRGKPIASGHKSVSFRMLFRDPNTTLRHEQVDPQTAVIVERLKIHLDAQLRG